IIYFFFFQAEDGIRDFHVTGVQTCALPISRNTENYDALIYVGNWPKPRILAWDTLLKARAIENMSYCIGVNRVGEDKEHNEYCRSEERREGKESRNRYTQYQNKKKKQRKNR